MAWTLRKIENGFELLDGKGKPSAQITGSGAYARATAARARKNRALVKRRARRGKPGRPQ